MSVLGCWITWQAYPWREASHPLLRRRTLRADGATVFGCHFGGHVLALLSHHIVHGEVQFFRCLLMDISASQSSFWDGQQWSMINLCGRLAINRLAGLWILPINSLIWWDGFETNFFSCCKSFWLAGKHPTESIETFCQPQPLSFCFPKLILKFRNFGQLELKNVPKLWIWIFPWKKNSFEVVVPGACYLEMIVAGCTTFLGTLVGSNSWSWKPSLENIVT